MDSADELGVVLDDLVDLAACLDELECRLRGEDRIRHAVLRTSPLGHRLATGPRRGAVRALTVGCWVDEVILTDRIRPARQELLRLLRQVG